MKNKITVTLLTIAAFFGGMCVKSEPSDYIPISDISCAWKTEDGCVRFELKDYGNIGDDPNARSYDSVVREINSYYDTVVYGDKLVFFIEPNGNTWSVDNS